MLPVTPKQTLRPPHMNLQWLTVPSSRLLDLPSLTTGQEQSKVIGPIQPSFIVALATDPLTARKSGSLETFHS